MPVIFDIDGVDRYKYQLQLVTTQDILDFVRITNQIDVPVVLTGVTEDGMDWRVSAKSLLGSITLFQVASKHTDTFNSIDYNKLYCLWEKDIYSQIQQFVKP